MLPSTVPRLSSWFQVVFPASYVFPFSNETASYVLPLNHSTLTAPEPDPSFTEPVIVFVDSSTVPGFTTEN